MVAKSHRRSRVRANAMAVVACLTVLVAPAISVPAQAATSDGDWWYSAMEVADAHADGWTGDGVKIAVIDSYINPDSPALAGADLAVDSSFVCQGGSGVVTEATDEFLHGTRVSQLLVRPDGLNGGVGGIAPDAEITVYPIGTVACQDPYVDGKSGLGRAIVAATDAGNDIISMSFGAETGTGQYDALAYAFAHGVVVVSSSPNSTDEASLVFPVLANGVVSVAAVSESLDLMTDGDDPVITPEVTVVAPGIGIGVVGANGDWAASDVRSGTSYAAPLVAGSLALAKQKFPDATGNQLVQALIGSTVSAQTGVPRDTVGGYGYGVVSIAGLLSSDPASLPDVNPLMDKSWGMPTEADIDAHRNQSADPEPSPTVEEQDDETTPPSTPADAGSDSSPGSSPLPWIIGGGIMVLGVGIVIFSVMRFRRTAGRS